MNAPSLQQHFSPDSRCFGCGPSNEKGLRIKSFVAGDETIAEWRPDALVVGVPFHPDGVAHENTLRARKFARQLQGRFHLPVFEVDERYSTTQALSQGARDADAASACIILEQFLRGLP